MKFNYTLLVISLFTTSAVAKLTDDSGLSGEISLNTGYSGQASNFNTDGNKTITTTSKKADKKRGFLTIPLGSVAYTFGQELDKQIYLGTAREDIAVGILALEIGYKQELSSGTVVDASFLPTIMSGETWANPYLLNTERTTTDESGYAFRLKFSDIAGSNVSLDTAYATKNIEDEQSSDELKRDADTVYIKVDYRFMLNRTSFLIPAISYITNDAEGSAASCDSWETKVSYFKLFNKHQLALTAGYKNSTYDSSSSIFGNKSRSDDTLSVFAAYEYQQFMNWKDWSFISFAGYSKSHSTIAFYDESNYIASVGLNYAF